MTWKVLLSVALSFCSLTNVAVAAQPPKFVEGQMIVRLAPNTDVDNFKLNLFTRKIGSDIRPLVPQLGIYLVKLHVSTNVHEATFSLKTLPGVLYSQADHYVRLRDTTPNDAQFAQQWSLHSPSQVDISAIRAWDLGTGGKDKAGNEIVVAVVDGGMDITHPDLAPNIWKNSGEIAANGKDDDGNGYVDDVNGWNAFSGNGTIPSASHGTHVAGILGAKGNNGAGVSGINWNVKIMPVAAASGTTSIVLAGYGYVLKMKQLWLQSHGTKGADIVATNSSFGVDNANCASGEFTAWNDIYNEMGKVGILSAAATANNNIDVDTQGDVPTGCSSDYLVKVTNTTQKDERNSQAGYGAKSIDIGAPGTDILSTLPGNKTGLLTGTSMATPHIAGSIAFLHSVASADFVKLYLSEPAKAAAALKAVLLGSVDKIPALTGTTVSGGRLNLFKASQAIASFKQAH